MSIVSSEDIGAKMTQYSCRSCSWPKGDCLMDAAAAQRFFLHLFNPIRGGHTPSRAQLAALTRMPVTDSADDTAQQTAIVFGMNRLLANAPRGRPLTSMALSDWNEGGPVGNTTASFLLTPFTDGISGDRMRVAVECLSASSCTVRLSSEVAFNQYRQVQAIRMAINQWHGRYQCVAIPQPAAPAANPAPTRPSRPTRMSSEPPF